MALSDSAGVGSALPSQVGVTSGWALTTDGTKASWASVGGGGGVTTMAAVGAVPNANAASISGVTLTMQPADATHPGVVTTAAQSFAGTKSFTGDIHVGNNAVTLSNQTNTIWGLWLAPNAASPTTSNWALVSLNDGALYLQADSSAFKFYVATAQIAQLNTTNLDLTLLGSGGSIKLKSPNGTTFTLTVSNAGALVIT